MLPCQRWSELVRKLGQSEMGYPKITPVTAAALPRTHGLGPKTAEKLGTGGGTRTRTSKAQGILSPRRLPFRHTR